MSPEERQRPELPAITTPQPETTEPAQIPLATAVHPTLSNPLEDGQNFVGLLQELSQSLGWALPAYQFTGASPEFVCTCTVVVQGQPFSGQGTTAQKKQAKQIAARSDVDTASKLVSDLVSEWR